MKNFFSLVNSVVGGEVNTKPKIVLLPWEDYKDQAKSLNIRGSLTDILKDNILEISLDEKNFISAEYINSSFVIDKYLDVIMKVLEVDGNLRELFRRIVPKKVTEEVFWRNYFAKVEEIKNGVLAKFSRTTSENKDSLDFHNSFLDELDKELEAEDASLYKSKPLKSPKSPQEPDEISLLKTQLEKALKKIEDLETRVFRLEQASKSTQEDPLKIEDE